MLLSACWGARELKENPSFRQADIARREGGEPGAGVAVDEIDAGSRRAVEGIARVQARETQRARVVENLRLRVKRGNGVCYFAPLFFGAGGFAEDVPLVAGAAVPVR